MHVFTAEKYSPFNISANNMALHVERQNNSVNNVIRNGKRREKSHLLYTLGCFFRLFGLKEGSCPDLLLKQLPQITLHSQDPIPFLTKGVDKIPIT